MNGAFALLVLLSLVAVFAVLSGALVVFVV
jgi:hypothetical protein